MIDDIWSIAIAFLVMLNPFALFVFLDPLRRNMEGMHFNRMLLRASMNSLMVFLVFYLLGDALFTKVFQINFDSFRIFGGIIIFTLAYRYIIISRKALIQFKQNINDLSIDVSVPFMVGAGTISLSILMGETAHQWFVGVFALVGVVALNHLIIISLGHARRLLSKRPDMFDIYMDAVMRINIFFIGAIGIDMVITGIQGVMYTGAHE